MKSLKIQSALRSRKERHALSFWTLVFLAGMGQNAGAQQTTSGAMIGLSGVTFTYLECTRGENEPICRDIVTVPAQMNQRNVGVTFVPGRDPQLDAIAAATHRDRPVAGSSGVGSTEQSTPPQTNTNQTGPGRQGSPAGSGTVAPRVTTPEQVPPVDGVRQQLSEDALNRSDDLSDRALQGGTSPQRRQQSSSTVTSTSSRGSSGTTPGRRETSSSTTTSTTTSTTSTTNTRRRREPRLRVTESPGRMDFTVEQPQADMTFTPEEAAANTGPADMTFTPAEVAAADASQGDNQGRTGASGQTGTNAATDDEATVWTRELEGLILPQQELPSDVERRESARNSLFCYCADRVVHELSPLDLDAYRLWESQLRANGHVLGTRFVSWGNAAQFSGMRMSVELDEIPVRFDENVRNRNRVVAQGARAGLRMVEKMTACVQDQVQQRLGAMGAPWAPMAEADGRVTIRDVKTKSWPLSLDGQTNGCITGRPAFVR